MRVGHYKRLHLGVFWENLTLGVPLGVNLTRVLERGPHKPIRRGLKKRTSNETADVDNGSRGKLGECVPVCQLGTLLGWTWSVGLSTLFIRLPCCSFFMRLRNLMMLPAHLL